MFLCAATLLAATVLAGCSRGAPVFTGDEAWRYLVKQCEYGPRVPGTAAHDSTKSLIFRALRSAGAAVSVQRFEIPDPYHPGEPLQLTNITGSFYPKSRRRFLVAAHYDCRPWADEDPDSTAWTQPVPGANDAASGVAVLLELAGILGRRPPGDLGVDLVFFDGEDYGKAGDLEHYLIGSKFFAVNLGGYRPVGGILLDMVGGRDARIGMEGNSLAQAPELTRALFERAAQLGLTVFVAEPADPVYDDHVPLLMAGIPTVDLIGLPYDHWHTVADTPDKCSPETLRQVGTLVADFLYRYPD